MAIWIIALIVKKKIMDSNIITVAIALVTSITSFIFGQHKAKREIESMTITNVQKSVDVYREIIEDLRGEVSELLIKVNQLEDKIDELHSENSQLRKMLKEYKNKS
jgi:peptidoglycan hydrolase CwlO-like protein